MSGRALFLFLGSLVLSFGLAFAGKHTFNGNVEYVFLGLMLYTLGYKLCQSSSLGDLEIFSNKGFTDSYLGELQLLLGVFLCSYGFVTAASFIESFDIFYMFSTGLSMVSGYAMAHRGFNGAII